MRTAYKAWSGVAAGVFCVVAATDMATMCRDMPDGALTGGYCARKWWC